MHKLLEKLKSWFPETFNSEAPEEIRNDQSHSSSEQTKSTSTSSEFSHQNGRMVNRKKQQHSNRNRIIIVTLVVIALIFGLTRLFGGGANRSNTAEANDKVEKLFTNADHTDTSSSVSDDTINDAYQAVDKLKDKSLKTKLNTEIQMASDMNNVKQSYKELFNNSDRLIGKESDIKAVQQDINNGSNTLNSTFASNYKDKLKSDLALTKSATKLHKQFKALVTAHQKEQSVDTKEVDSLITKMKKLDRSQQMVDDITLANNLKKQIKKDEASQAKSAAEDASRAESESAAAASQAQSQAEETSRANEAAAKEAAAEASAQAKAASESAQAQSAATASQAKESSKAAEDASKEAAKESSAQSKAAEESSKAQESATINKSSSSDSNDSAASSAQSKAAAESKAAQKSATSSSSDK